MNLAGLFNISLEVEDLMFNDLKISKDVPLMDLMDSDEVKFELNTIQGIITGNYTYVTDPPLAADLGEFHMEGMNTTFSIQGKTDWDNETGFIMDLEDLNLDFIPFTVLFDGVSDMSNVISRLVTFVSNVALGRLSSISKFERTTPKLNNLINEIIGLIPDEIDIPGTQLYIEGGLNDKLVVKKKEWMKLSMDVSVHDKAFPMTNFTNTANFGPPTQNGYDLETYMSDYFLESFMWAAYYQGLLNIQGLPIPITTTELDIPLLGQLSRHGFSWG